MGNQHKLIKGYRDLSQEEIDLMNKIKALANQVGELVAELEVNTEKYYFTSDEDGDTTSEACKWVSNGKRDLQLGFMQLTRAIAKPTSF